MLFAELPTYGYRPVHVLLRRLAEKTGVQRLIQSASTASWTFMGCCFSVRRTEGRAASRQPGCGYRPGEARLADEVSERS